MHYWSGGTRDEKPPGCRPGGQEIFVKQPGKGSLDADGKVDFGASSYTIDRVACGQSSRYNPDHFTGKIDLDRQEFQSVNNDGGRYINDPFVFRRVRCANEPHRGSAKAAPPAFAPPSKRTFGCSR